MTDFLIILQIFGICILLGELVYVMIQKPSQVQIYLTVMLSCTIVAFLGYLIEMTAENLDQALIGVKISYLGKPFATLSTFFFVSIYCKIKIPRYVKAILVLFYIVIFVVVFTCEKHELFYKNIYFSQEYVVGHVKKDPGPLYFAFIGSTIFYLFANGFLAVRTLFRTHSKTERHQTYFVFGIMTSSGLGMITFLTGITNGYDTTYIGLLIASIFLCVLFARYRIIDTLSLAKDQALDDYSDGFVVINQRNEVIYANQEALSIYPEFSNQHNPDLVVQLEELSEKGEYLFTDQKVKWVRVKEINKDGLSYGKRITLADVTDSYYYAERLANDVEERTKKIKHIQRSVIASFANIVEARDNSTGTHIKNTSLYVNIIARALRYDGFYQEILTDEYIEILTDVAPLHDIGKIVIPDKVLQKPGKLTEEEYEIIKTHTTIGVQLVEENLSGVETDEYTKIAKEVVLSHHEKWDGTGYPNGLKGEEIPLSARIMAISDVYDALISKRCYKDAFTKEKALSIIKESKGSHFDPTITEVFLRHLEEIDAVEKM